MAGTVTVKLYELLKSIGVDVSQQSGSNVKTLATKNKSTATKPGLLAGERDTGGNFGTVLDIFKREAQFIDGMDDAQQMAFLNNIMDYKEFGGKSINKASEGITGLEKNLEDLQSTAKTMKDDAEKGLASAEKDLKDFLETGGQPLKAKSDKYLGGSMHEEGQLRTAIRTFLRNEFKEGRIKLDKDDQFRIMEYSPMMEDDPIKVFKKIYGDEAYTKAGTFPGAFEKGENFTQYESIFKENMGEDILKVKDKKYVGDGKLILTKQEEVFEPTPDDDDVPFAKGGRASFAGGKLTDEIVAMLVKKEPMDAMKELNKIIGKKGNYKNLTQKDIDKIVNQTNDHIFQRDPDNLFVGKNVDDMSIEDSLTTLEGLGATKMAERFKLKQRYPGISEDLLTNIIEDTDPVHRASVLAKMDQAMKLIVGEGKGTDEAIDILKSEPKTKMATGGRAGYSDGNIVYEGEGPIQFDLPFGEPMFTMKMNGKLFGIYKNKNGSHLSVPLGSDGKPNYAKGGRAGYYSGGQAMIEPDLSDVGHGSDALMARTRLTAPGSQATTSTGLNYLLGEDNDNTRVPFNNGLLVPPKKPMPAIDPFTELKRVFDLYKEAAPGVDSKTREFLKNNFLKKLKDSNISQEEFMANRMQSNFADGGVASLRQGYASGGGIDIARRGFLKFLGGTAAGVVALKTGLAKILGKESGAVSKKVIDEVIIDGGSGAPAWLQPLVNKALREGTDISKQAIKDGQVVKSLDTPTGKVDVYYDTRTGEIDIDYIGGNTAMGEGVQMRYTPGIADEGTKGVKPADEFEAVESVPEFQGGNSPDGPDLDFGENVTSDVKGLYSDTSELAELGGQKPLIKDISNSIKKKQALKKMDESPQEFAQEQQPDVYYKD